MKSEALDALFLLMETEEDDFSALLARYGIDPANDLRHCDLSNVDFGRLRADVLDLTGADLQGADLSKVECKQIIGAEEPAPRPPKERGSLENALVAVARYQNGDWVTNEIRSRLDESAAPVLAFYDTAAEQDILTKRLCALYDDASHIREGIGEEHGTKLIWFYTKAPTAQLKLNPAFLDAAFFNALRSSNTSSDIGIYPLRPNQAAVDRIKAEVPRTSYDQMRTAFVRSLRRELSVRSGSMAWSYKRSILLFSGFPPISKRLFEEIRNGGLGRTRLIFLCSSHLEPHYLADKGVNWRRFAVPPYALGETLANEADLHRLMKRVTQASSGEIKVTLATERKASALIGKPLAAMKRLIMDDLRASEAISLATGL